MGYGGQRKVPIASLHYGQPVHQDNKISIRLSLMLILAITMAFLALVEEEQTLRRMRPDAIDLKNPSTAERTQHQLGTPANKAAVGGPSLSRGRAVNNALDGSPPYENAVVGHNATTISTSSSDSHTGNAQQQRVMLLRNSRVHGHANQQQCLHMASVLAVQYNRTLLLPHNAGCRPNKHQNFGIPMGRLYDTERAKRMIDYRELASGETTPSQCLGSQKIHSSHMPDFRFNVSDPFTQDSCIVFDCGWADTHMHAPKSMFPKVDEIYFRYHTRYWEMGNKILTEISKSGSSINRILAIQIRRGDRDLTWPLLNCPSSDDDPLVLTRLCRRLETRENHTNDSELTWNDLFELLPTESTNTSSATNVVDAIFVATNDVKYVNSLKKQHKRKGRRKLAPLYMLTDFIPQIRHLLLPETLSAKHLSSTVELLVIEQTIMALADHLIPSFPSTVPDNVFRMRLSLQPRIRREQQHYDLYDTEYTFHFNPADLEPILDAMNFFDFLKQGNLTYTAEYSRGVAF